MTAYTFNLRDHTMTLYTQAATAFIDQVGCTPMDVLSSPATFSFEIRKEADYINAWDLWLFSQEDADE